MGGRDQGDGGVNGPRKKEDDMTKGERRALLFAGAMCVLACGAAVALALEVIRKLAGQ